MALPELLAYVLHVRRSLRILCPRTVHPRLHGRLIKIEGLFPLAFTGPHGCVRPLVQVKKRIARTRKLRPGGDPQPVSQAKGLPGPGQSAHDVFHLVCRRLPGAGPWQEYGERVSSHAPAQSRSKKRIPQYPGQLPQSHIPGRVAVLIIDIAELVHIHHYKQTDWPVLQKPVHLFLHGASVQKPREGIPLGQQPQPVNFLFQFIQFSHVSSPIVKTGTHNC